MVWEDGHGILYIVYHILGSEHTLSTGMCHQGSMMWNDSYGISYIGYDNDRYGMLHTE